MSSTGVPMVKEGAGDVTGNGPGQGFTSPSTCTHVQGVSGAPTAADGGAADGRRSMRRTSVMHQGLRITAKAAYRRTQCVVLSAPICGFLP